MKPTKLFGVLISCCLLWTCTPWNLPEKEFLSVQIGFLDGVDKERVHLRSSVSSLNTSNSVLHTFVSSYGYVFDTDPAMLSVESASKIISFTPDEGWSGEHRGIIEGFEGMRTYYALAFAQTQEFGRTGIENVFYSDTITFSTHWRKKGSIPDVMNVFWDGTDFVIGNEVYFGFWHSNPPDPKNFLRLNPATGNHRFIPNKFPGDNLLGNFAFVIDNQAYVAFGIPEDNPDAFVRDVFSLDAQTENWQPKATNQSLAGRAHGVSLLINGIGYMISGDWIDPNTFERRTTTQVLAYDPAKDSLFQLEPINEFFPTPNFGFVVDNVGYVYFTGDAASHFYRFDPSQSPMWTSLPQFTIPGVESYTRNSKVIVVDNKAYLGMGPIDLNGNTIRYSEFYALDIGNFSWTRIDFPGRHRIQTHLVSVGGKGYLIGGYFVPNDPGFVNDIYLEQSSTDIWEFTP